MASSRTPYLPPRPPTCRAVALVLVTGFMLVSLPLSAFALAATALQEPQGESPRFWLTSALHYQELSFTSNGPGADFTLGLQTPGEWTVWAGFSYVEKFGHSVAGYRMGGSYWAGARTLLASSIELAPEQVVLPLKAYSIEISHTYGKGLVPSLSYRFADYSTVNAHAIMPGFIWYFRRFYWVSRYYLVVSQFSGQAFTTHSGLARVHWNVAGPVTLFAGYARANESFESGNPADPFAGFSADHLLSGLSWDIHERMRVRFALDYESRNNGSTLRTYDMEMSYRW